MHPLSSKARFDGSGVKTKGWHGGQLTIGSWGSEWWSVVGVGFADTVTASAVMSERTLKSCILAASLGLVISPSLLA